MAGCARDALAPLLAATGLDIHDTPDGLCVARASVREPLPIGEVVAEDGPLVTVRRPDPGEAVGQVALGYIDRLRDYQSGSVTAICPDAGALDAATTTLVLDADGARAVAELTLRQRTAPRDRLGLVLPPSMLALEPGDAIERDGEVYAVTEVRDGLARAVTAVIVPPTLAVATAAQPATPMRTPAPRAAPVLDAAHLPPSIDAVTQSRLALGAFARPWPGELIVTEEESGAGVARLNRTATLGELTASLTSGGIYRWDMLNAVDVVLHSGHLSSADDDLVLAGTNRIAVETDSGAWEVVGFADAELTAPRQYRLTRLLRGQWGTDAAIGTASAGNRVMLLDTRPTLTPVPARWLDTTLELRSYAGASDPVGEVSTVDVGLGPVLPMRPVHLQAVRAASGDVTLRWVRRSRADGDSWTPEDAPLEHTPEAYRVTILDAGTPVRTIDAATASAIYEASQQTADFGSPPASFDFTVAQTSQVYGPGHAATGTFHA